MAQIVDREGNAVSAENNVDLLTEIMNSAQMEAAILKVPAKRRYAELVVRAAIRRDGFTDAGQRLVMSSEERERWDELFPVDA